MNIMTLTEVSYYARKYLPHAILAAIIGLIVYYSIQIFTLLYKSEKKEVFTDTTFGLISKPFIKDASSSAGIKFSLDTIEGTPVTATAAARVFFLPPAPAKFGYRESAFLMAQNLGFDVQSAKYRLVNKQAIFEDEKQKLTVDIGNFNFNYRYDFEKEPELFDSFTIPTSETAESSTLGFLQNVGRYPQELVAAEIQPIYFFYDPDEKNLKQVSRNTDANLVEIDFFRPKVDGYPIVTSKFPNSQNYVLGYYNADEEFKVLKAQIAFFEKSEEQVGIYPLKTGKQAYEALQKGGGLVLSNAPKNYAVVVKKMFLAYFDPDVYQDYLQPVYVFIGEANFVAFVPAVSDEFLVKK